MLEPDHPSGEVINNSSTANNRKNAQIKESLMKKMINSSNNQEKTQQKSPPLQIENIEQEFNEETQKQLNLQKNVSSAPLKNSPKTNTSGRLRSIFNSSVFSVHGTKDPKQRRKSLHEGNVNYKNNDFQSSYLYQNFEENKLESLFFSLKQLTREQRFDKAVRHFRECLSLRHLRHDVEQNQSKFFKVIYFWQTSDGWQALLFIVGFLFPILSFFEPANHLVKSYTDNSSLLIFETILISFIGVDLILESYHLYFDKDRSIMESYVKNLLYSSRFLIFMLLLIDCMVFHGSFPSLTYRYSRYLRPFLVFYYSNELRRTLISIIKSLQKITQLVFFIFFLTFFFAIIGWRFIGNLDGTSDQDYYPNDFTNLGSAANIMYSLISFDNYPDCMIPAYNSSGMFAFYFITYCILLVMLFVPIPVAVVYEAFRQHRSKFVLIDRISQRDTLLCCFISLDFFDEKAVSYSIFKEFMTQIYLQRKRFIKKIRPLYLNLDENDSNSISLNEFFDIIDVLEKNPSFQIPSFPDYAIWDKVRKLANQKLYFKLIAKSLFFEIFMLLVLIGNCIVLFINMSTSDQSVIDLTDELDDYFFYLYTGEFLIKLIGLGVEKFFNDSWNVFDFFMVFMSALSIALSTTLSFLRSAKSAKATKILRLTKINRIFRIFKALRSVKFLNLILSGFELFYQVKVLVVKILMCLPIVIRLIPINLMLIYIYSYIALETFNTETFDFHPGSPFESGYADFTSFSDSLLIFFQITLEANWSSYIYDNLYKFNTPFATRAIFLSFDFITQFILLSLIKGIVWEVFTIVNDEIKIRDAAEQKRNDLTFMKVDDINKLLYLKPQHLIEESAIFYKQHKGKTPSVHPVAESVISKQRTSIASFSSCQYSSLSSDLRGIMIYEDILKNLNSPNSSLNHKQEESQPQSKMSQQQSVIQKEPQQKKQKTECVPIVNAPKFQPIVISHSVSPSKNQNNVNAPKEENSNQNASQETSQKLINSPEQLIQDLKNEEAALGIKETDDLIQKDRTTYSQKMPSPLSLKGESSKQNEAVEPKRLITSSSDNSLHHSEVNINPQILRKSQNQIKSENSPVHENEKANEAQQSKAENNYIFWLRKHIKPFSFLVKKQNGKKREENKEINFSEDFILSDDEDAMEEYQKEMNQFLFEEEAEKNALNLKIKEGADEMGSLNFQYMMRRALLKDSNLDLIKKVEIDYFQLNYGTFFNVFHQVKISPILHYESFLIYNFEKVLRHNTVSSEFFFNVLTSLEMNISKVILRKGSVAKFVFEDSQGNWVCLKEIKKKIYPCILGKGPWNYYKTVFQQEKEISVGKDLFVLLKNNQSQSIICDFYSQFRTCARCIEREHHFLTLAPEFSIFDFYSIFFENKQEQQTVASTMKALLKQELRKQRQVKKKESTIINSKYFKKEEAKDIKPEEAIKGSNQANQQLEKQAPNNQKQIPDISVPIYATKVMLMILPYIGESEEDKNNERLRMSKGEVRKSLMNNDFQNEEDSQIFGVDQKKKQRESINHIDMDQLNRKQTKEKEKINDQSTLPTAFIIEMIQSLKNIMDHHQQNLFFHFSYLVNSMMKEDHYFDKIIEDNVEEVEQLRDRKNEILQKKVHNKTIFEKVKVAKELEKKQ